MKRWLPGLTLLPEERGVDPKKPRWLVDEPFNGPHRPPDEQPRGNSVSVYFIQAEHGGPIKIGVTVGSAEDRRRALQTGHPYPLVVRRVLQTSSDMERRLHVMFAEHRLSGEWFQAVPALANLADAIPDESGDDAVDGAPRMVQRPPDELSDNGLGGCKDFCAVTERDPRGVWN